MENIKVLIFDVDGTLYKDVPAFSKILHTFRIEKIANHFKISKKEAEEKLANMEKKYKSVTKGFQKLGFGTLLSIVRATERVTDRRKYIEKDSAVVKLMINLSKKYRLFLLRNGTIKASLQVLEALGFEKKQEEVFERVFSSVEDFGSMKPDLESFIGVLTYTKLKPEEHLMVGDRISVDLTPAKKMGMKTALVTWGKKFENNPGVDYYLNSIYDIQNLLKSFQ